MRWFLWVKPRRLPARLVGGALLLTLPLTIAYIMSTVNLGSIWSPRTAAAAPVQSAQRASIDPHVATGALDFITFGCENCHGLYGRGGVRVPNITGSATIPALNTPAIRASLNVATLRFFIKHGVVLKSNVTRVYMPVWGAVLSDHQVSDLVTYIRAGLPQIVGIDPQPVRTDLGQEVEGQQLYTRFGCVVCHAFNGFGGVPNPSSPDKAVPPLRGAKFDNQFVKDSDIAYVIQHGSIIGGSPIVSMPVWSGLLSDQQTKALVAYIRTFH